MSSPAKARRQPASTGSARETLQPVRIGLVAGEPIRLEGLRSIFDQPAASGHPPLVPVIGALEELIANPVLEFLVVDTNSAGRGLETLQAVRRARPDMRQIVIGPENDDEFIMDSVIAGARAYLDSAASPETVRMAIEIAVSGSIWAPRRLLSKLIDRLLGISRSAAQSAAPSLTDRERQVLELILLARSTREIAAQLGIEERTVKAHIGRLMHKTGAENRVELSIRALNQSLIPRKPARS